MINTVICPCRLQQALRGGGLDGKKRRLWPEVCWYTLCFLTHVSAQSHKGWPLRRAHVLAGSHSSGTAVSVPQYRGVTASSARILLHLSLCRIWWYASSRTSQYWGTFQKQHMYGGGWGGRRKGGGLFKRFPNKNLLLLSVVNIDLTYFCYNSI